MWKEIFCDFRRTWPQLLVADLLAKIVVFVVLSPIVGLLLRFFLSASGNVAIKDEDILFFFLRPLGIATVLVAGGGVLAIAFFLQAVLMAIAFASAHEKRLSYFDAIRFALGKISAIFGLAVRMLARVLLIAAPFAVAGGIVYFVFLTKFDINYYLTEKPPAFQAALVLGAVIVVALVAVLARLLISWAVALQVLLFESVPSAKALPVSRERTKGKRVSITAKLAIWLLGCFVISSLATGLMVGAARLLVPSGSSSLGVVTAVVSVLAVVAVLVNLVVSFLAAAFLSLLLVKLHMRLGQGSDVSGVFPFPLEPLEGKATFRLPRKGLLWGGLGAFAAAVVISVFLLNTLKIEDEVDVTAHRGYSAVAPENSLAAVQRAIEAGADWAEIDVQETADGVVVIAHDRDLKKSAGLDLRVEESNWADLQKADIGIGVAPEFAGQRIPTLAEVLDLCKGRIGVNIELKFYGKKGSLEERVIALVEERGMQDQIVLMSLKSDSVKKLKALRPDWTVGLLAAKSVGDLTKLDVDFLAVNTSMATGRFIRAAHKQGKTVSVWTVDDPITMSAMISRGADDLITNKPELARSVLEQRAQMNPVERLLVRVGAALGVLQARDIPSTDDDA